MRTQLTGKEPMFLLLALLLVCPLCHAKISAAQLILLRYSILDASEIRFFPSSHYAFEVCSCTTKSTDPKYSRHCRCEDLKGRNIREIEPSGSISKDDCYRDRSRCLVAGLFLDDKRPMTFYLRVSANGQILTLPSWQELQLQEGTNEQTLGSSSRRPIKLTYAMKSDSSLQKLTTSRDDAPTSTTTTTTTTTTTEIATMAPETNEIDEEMDSGEEQQNINRHAYHSNRVDAYKFIGIPTINHIRQALVDEAWRDRIPPWRYDLTEFKDQVLRFHNELRAMHGSPPLEYDMGVEWYAQNWANQLAARGSCIAHDYNRRFGECLFYTGTLLLPNTDTFAALVTQSFYLENNQYDYVFRPMSYYRTGHFTQMIWKNSRRMGVGIAIQLAQGGGAPCRPYYPTYQVYVVVKYDPPGNVQNPYAYDMNVRPRLY